MTRAKLLPAALFALLPVAAGCGASGPDGTSSGGEPVCAAPMTSVADSTVTPGQTVQVSAEGLWSSCRDNGIVDEDGNAHDPNPEPTPLTALHVRWTQGDTVVDLGVIDVTIPADARAGEAELTVGLYSAPAVVTVVAEEASPSTSP